MSDLHVIFRVGDEDYAIPLAEVRVMESFEGATRVPGAPAWVEGLVQIRSDVLPVVDLRRRFGLPPHDRGLDDRVIVVEVGPRAVGLLVDRAREVHRIAPGSVRPPPEEVVRGAERFVRAVAQAGDRLVMLIDPERVVGEEALEHVE